MYTRGFTLLAASLLLLMLASGSQICQRPPTWTINQLNPMAEARSKGHVVFLGLLLASGGFCRWQASTMNSMYREMVMNKNLSDVSFMILNMKEAAATIKLLTEKVSFPVYQEPASQDIMGLLGGRKDDILIYDRCGLLVDHFSMPHSYLGYPFVTRSLLNVIKNNSKCRNHCPVTRNPATGVNSDQYKTTQLPSANHTTDSTLEGAMPRPRPDSESATSSAHTETGSHGEKKDQNRMGTP